MRENRSNSSAPSTGFPSQGSPTSNLARFPTEHLLLQLLYIGPMNDEELQLEDQNVPGKITPDVVCTDIRSGHTMPLVLCSDYHI